MSQLIEKHLAVFTPEYPAGEEEYILDETHDVWIKSYSIYVLGKAMASGECGYVYLWRDVDHYTLMLPLEYGTPRMVEKSFGDDYLLLPAGEDLCIRWVLPSTGYMIGGDVTYVLAT